MKLIKITLTIFILSQFSFGQNSLSNGEEKKQESNRIALVINSWLKPTIDNNLIIYIEDLKNEGYDVVLKEWNLENEPSPRALKTWLKGLYEEPESLQGAVLIGQLPIPRVKAHSILKGGDVPDFQIADSYISEMYYMDLIGREWKMDADSHQFEEPEYESKLEAFLKQIESYTPKALWEQMEKEELYPIAEIWTSRIIVSTVEDILESSESELVNAYLEKNHAYRTGKVVFSKQSLLYALPEVMKDDEAFDSVAVDNLRNIWLKQFGPGGLKEPKPAPSGIDEFLEPLENEAYEIFYWGRHGLPTSINLGTGSLLTSYLLATTPIKISTVFVFPSSCLIGNYETPDYFAGTYVFNKNFYVLGMTTGSLSLFYDVEIAVLDEFKGEQNLGLAFKKGMQYPFLGTEIVFLYFAEDMASRNSRYILGDGTLTLQQGKYVANENNSPKKYLQEKHPINEGYTYEYLEEYVLSGGIKHLDKFIRMNGDAGLAWDGVITRNDTETAQLLIDKGKLEARDVNKRTPLIKAVIANNSEMVDVLLQRGAAIEARDISGYTPLMWAAYRKNIQIIKLLLKAGALKSGDNYASAWYIAKQQGASEEILELLKVPEEKEL